MFELNRQELSAYLLAGKSTFTVKNPTTGNHVTYKVSVAKDVDNLYFVRGRAGQGGRYIYLGYFNYPNHNLQASKKSEVNNPQWSHLAGAFQWILKKAYGFELPESLEVYHEGACGRCGMKLTTPKSLLVGFGPVCKRLMAR